MVNDHDNSYRYRRAKDTVEKEYLSGLVVFPLSSIPQTGEELFVPIETSGSVRGIELLMGFYGEPEAIRSEKNIEWLMKRGVVAIRHAQRIGLAVPLSPEGHFCYGFFGVPCRYKEDDGLRKTIPT